MSYAIRAHELSKHYQLYRRPADRLIELVSPSPRHQTFRALENVSFEIHEGETVGVIGRNGAGKSTLLKLLSDVTQATSGTLEVRGTVASILELGTGFHPDFTGRNNASLNATILGVGPRELKEILPRIYEFSELGEFLDQPVKTYSSGMFMRLAFAVAVNVDPDILVVDEALAVGDGHFQKKCFDRIREFQERRKTILFCSHALATVTSLCKRVLWLDGGRVMRFGPAADVVREYEHFLLQQETSVAVAHDERSTPIRMANVTLRGRNDEPKETFSPGEPFTIDVDVESALEGHPVHLLVGVDRRIDQVQCFTFATHWDGLAPVVPGGRVMLRARVDALPIVSGDYLLYLFLGDELALHIYDRREIPFTVKGPSKAALFDVPHEWVVT